MAKLTLRLHPADVLMFRETRWFGTGAGASDSQFPMPRTIAGALRTYMMDACGMDYKALREALKQARDGENPKMAPVPTDYMTTLKAKLKERCPAAWPIDATLAGPFLSREDGTRLFPVPRTIVVTDEGTTGALAPVLQGKWWNSADGLMPLALGQDAAWEQAPEAYITGGQLSSYLKDGTAPSFESPQRSRKDLFLHAEPRVGVSLSPTDLTAVESLLYTSTFTRLKEGCCLEVDVSLDDAGANDLKAFSKQRPWMRLGGAGGVARVEIADKAWEPWKPAETVSRPLVYLATPGLFAQGGWRPGTLSPSGAAVGRPQPFSGWDLAANLPMPSRYAVPAGAVYFLEEDAAQQAMARHGACISDDENDRAAGWGFCLTGGW